MEERKLPHKLTLNERRELTMTGVTEVVSFEENAVVLQSKYPEATILVDAQCTDSFDKGLHEKVLDVLSGFQVKVINR